MNSNSFEAAEAKCWESANLPQAMSEKLLNDELKPKRPKVKRNRIPLSCEFCRKRKAKCDRQRPYCSTCARIGKKDECIYVQSVWKGKSAKGAHNSAIHKETKTKENDLLKHEVVLPPALSMSPLSKQFSVGESINSVTSLHSPAGTQLPPLNWPMHEAKKTPNLSPASQSSGKNDFSQLLLGMRKTDTTDSMTNTPYVSQASEKSFVDSSFSLNHYGKLSSVESLLGNGSSEFQNYSKVYDYIGIGEDDIVDFYEGFNSMLCQYEKITNYGPLAWMSLVMKDPYGRPIREEVMKYKENMMFMSKKDSDLHADKFLMSIGFDDIKEINISASLGERINSDMMDIEGSKSQFKGMEITTKYNVFQKDLSDKFLLHQILRVLPCKKAIWLLIDRFFSHVYPIFPYLDQFYFISDVEMILKESKYVSPDSEDVIKSLKINKKLDFAILGVLLMVLKLAESSYVGTPENEMDSEYMFLQKWKVADDIVAVAEMCLDKFNILKKCAFPVFQLALLLREYEIYSGSTDVSNPGGQILISLLIQLGTSIGLNRDPSKMDIGMSNGRMGNLWRKIWYGLVSIDSKQVMLFGNGRAISEDFYDTQLPIFDETSSNIDDLDLEREVIEKIKLNYKYDQVCIKLACYACSLKHKPKIRCLLNQLINLEQMIYENFGTLKDILSRDASTHAKKMAKFWDVSIFVQVMGLVDCIYLNLFMYYQKIRNFRAAKFVKFKGIYCWIQIFSNIDAITADSTKYFGPGLIMIISHIVLPIIHRGWIGLSSIYVSAFLASDKLKENKDTSRKYQLMMTVINSLGESGQWYLSILKRLSGKCFYAWKSMKAHSFILELIRNKRFIFKSLSHLYNPLDEMTEADCMNLLEIVDTRNYRCENKESTLFKTVKERLVNNKIDHVIDMDFYSKNTNYMGFDLINDSDSILDARLPLDMYTKSGEVDNFWRNVFAQRKSLVIPKETIGEPFAQHAREPSVNGDVVDSMLNSTPDSFNIFDNTDLFVNRVIFDMFN